MLHVLGLPLFSEVGFSRWKGRPNLSFSSRFLVSFFGRCQDQFQFPPPKNERIVQLFFPKENNLLVNQEAIWKHPKLKVSH